jgi:hypothetical protein
VTRTGGSSGAVGVTYATVAGGSTTAGADYTSVSNTLAWSAGDAANKTFQVPITNDVAPEPDETLYLALTSPTGGATLGAPNSAVLTIVDNDAPPPSYSITGRVTDGSNAALPNVSVTRSGSATAVLSNSAGYYTFTGLAPATYTITPAMTGLVFNPATRQATITNANVTGQNFIGGQGYNVTGRVSNTNGTALPNVSISRGGGSASVLSNSAGYFTLTNVPPGNHILTPTLAGYGFTPASRNITMSGANLANQNFVGSQGYTITGRIATSSSLGIAGVTVTRTGGGAAVLTNSAGYYTLANVPNGNYTITPSKPGMTFTPPSKSVSVNGANLANLNFMGT